MEVKINIDDEKLNLAKNITGIKDIEVLLLKSLELLIARNAQMEIRKLRGKVEWDGDLEKMRESRYDLS